MKRYLLNELVSWKERSGRKPLILWGARQVGKTWLMREFGRLYYDHTVYISFYRNKMISDIFQEDYDVRRILRAIEVELHVHIDPERTLLIFDEVQGCQQAVESLKYFCEDAGEYHVIAAGSLLGVSLHEGVSFPVGKVDELHLYPMSFEEFLEAMDEEGLASILLAQKTDDMNRYRDRFRELLRTYYIVGGMPEVVLNYRTNRDLVHMRDLQLSIVNQYEGDFGKHVSERELPRIRMVWNSLPMQLAKENKKYFFGQVKKGARQKDFEVALQWLSDAGLITKVNKVTKPAMPLKAYVDQAAFKLYLIDIGLLGAMSELDPESVMRGNDIFTEFKGALTEQFVLQQMVADTKYTPYYYAGEKSTYEVDFLIQKGRNVIPIEVKAEENLRSKSLQVYVGKFQPEYAVRTSMSPYRRQDWLVNIPLWGVGQLL